MRDGTATDDHDGAFPAAADCGAAGLLGIQPRILSENALEKRKVLSEQPFSGSIQDFFFCHEYPDKQQIIFELDLFER